MKNIMMTAAIALAATSALAAPPKQKVTGPDASYWMTAITSGSAEKGSTDGEVGRSLMLQLNSSRTAQGKPAADHLPPAALSVGESLPLESMDPGTVSAFRDWYKQGKPSVNSGKTIIYWGCGEQVRAGQPFVIDHDAPDGGKTPPAGVPIKQAAVPTASESGTYGFWPNQMNGTRVPAEGSLAGKHVVRGNYAPEIQFTLAANQDFLAPVTLKSAPAASAGGSIALSWNAVPNAKGFFAAASNKVGADRIYWTSNENLDPNGAPYLLEADEATRLVQKKVLLAPQQTQCTIPAEAARALAGGGLNIMAYGPEANFSYPPRPSNPATPWHISWTAKLLTRASFDTSLPGSPVQSASAESSSDEEAYEGGDEEEAADEEQEDAPTDIKSKVKKGIGGALKKIF
jgi:hypothetical protein